MLAPLDTVPPSILMFGQDARLVETRHWVLEQSGFRLRSVLRLPELAEAALHQPFELFILCDSLTADTRTQAVDLIRTEWPAAKLLVLVSTASHEDLEAPAILFTAMDGPYKLVATIKTLLASGPAPPEPFATASER